MKPSTHPPARGLHTQCLLLPYTPAVEDGPAHPALGTAGGEGAGWSGPSQWGKNSPSPHTPDTQRESPVPQHPCWPFPQGNPLAEGLPCPGQQAAWHPDSCPASDTLLPMKPPPRCVLSSICFPLGAQLLASCSQALGRRGAATRPQLASAGPRSCHCLATLGQDTPSAAKP